MRGEVGLKAGVLALTQEQKRNAAVLPLRQGRGQDDDCRRNAVLHFGELRLGDVRDLIPRTRRSDWRRYRFYY